MVEVEIVALLPFGNQKKKKKKHSGRQPNSKQPTVSIYREFGNQKRKVRKQTRSLHNPKLQRKKKTESDR